MPASNNPVAARLRGISVGRVTLLVFTLSGAAAGLAGILYAARFGYVNPGITGVGFEFTVIAAVVIGGVSINGGVGSVPGAILGVLLLGMVNVALPILKVSACPGYGRPLEHRYAAEVRGGIEQPGRLSFFGAVDRKL